MGALAWGSSTELAKALFQYPKQPILPPFPVHSSEVILTHLEFENLLRTHLEYRLRIMNVLQKTNSVESLYCLIDLFEWETVGTVELETSIIHEFIIGGSPREIFLDPALRLTIVNNIGNNSIHFTNLKKFILTDLKFNSALNEWVFVDYSKVTMS